jgi:hypothetical protein
VVAGVSVAKLTLHVTESAGSNDHQVRICVNGTDWLGPDHLGLDPPDFSRELIDPLAPSLHVGRCSCGCMGCGDVVVAVEATDRAVIWNENARRVAFDKAQYLSEIQRACLDQSWRPLNRQVEHKLDQFFADYILDACCTFRWTSTRCTLNQITLAFDTCHTPAVEYQQRLVEFDWDGQSVGTALAGADRHVAYLGDRLTRR